MFYPSFIFLLNYLKLTYRDISLIRDVLVSCESFKLKSDTV